MSCWVFVPRVVVQEVIVPGVAVHYIHACIQTYIMSWAMDVKDMDVRN